MPSKILTLPANKSSGVRSSEQIRGEKQQRQQRQESVSVLGRDRDPRRDDAGAKPKKEKKLRKKRTSPRRDEYGWQFPGSESGYELKVLSEQVGIRVYVFVFMFVCAHACSILTYIHKQTHTHIYRSAITISPRKA
jgi:hypothetical protein